MKIWSLKKVFYCKWCLFVCPSQHTIRCLLLPERPMYPWKVGEAEENEKYQAVSAEGGHNKVNNCEYKIDGKHIALATCFKYLGVRTNIRYFFLDLHVQSIASAANVPKEIKRIGYIYYTLQAFFGICMWSVISLFDQTYRPNWNDTEKSG